MAAASVILVVVDDPAHRVLFNRHLLSTPHHLVFATDGEDGFDRFGEVKPDLVLAHAAVARLDGTILCQLLRQQPRGDVTPIVLLGEAASGDGRATQQAAAVGADAFLPVPFSRSLLLEVITPLLAFGRPRPVPAAPSTGRSPSSSGHLTEVGLELGAADRAVIGLADDLDTDGAIGREAAPAPARSSEPDVDTVVGFRNPFAPAGAPVAAEPAPAAPPPRVETSPTLSDRLLEEPAISPGYASPEDPSASGKSGLIRELPIEATPTGGDAADRARADQGVRRGLDESLLGKRLMKRVRTLHRVLDQVDHYQLLGVPETASFDQLRQAYFDLSLELHPDRFFLLRSGELKEQIYVVFRRVGEAFDTLADDERRAAYDAARRAASGDPGAPLEVRPRAVAARDDLAIGEVGRDAAPFVALAQRAHLDGDPAGVRLGLLLARHAEPGHAGLERALGEVVRRQRPAL